MPNFNHSDLNAALAPAADLSPSLTPAALAAAIDRHEAAALPRLRLLWTYYRNPMLPRGVPASTTAPDTFRAWRLAQERSLPPRLLGDSRPALDDRARARKEIVIENDIAWRVHAMVDFMFGQRVKIASTARDPALRERINRALDAVWEASGGVAFMQDLALLGNVYGYVDLIVRASPLAPAEESGTQHGTPQGSDPHAPLHGVGGDREPASDPAALIARARSAVRVEMIEPARGVPLLAPDDYRRLSAYVLRYRAAAPSETASAAPRYSLWRRVLRGLSIDAPIADEVSAPDAFTVTEIIGPRLTRVYHHRPGRAAELVSEHPSLVSAERDDNQPPVVHIQNLSQPFHYEGLSEVEPLIPLQDELNIRLSDRASRVTMQSFRMYLAKGIDGATELPIAPNTVWSTDNPEADIRAFGGDADAPSEAEHVEQIREAMDKQSGVPPLASGVVRAKIGNLSSENALKITLMGLLSKTARKRVSYGHGLARASRLILEALDRQGILLTDEADRDVRVDWPDPLPRDERQTLDNALKKIELGVPREQVLSELGYASADPGVE